MNRSALKIICILSGILLVILSILGILAFERAIETVRGISIIGGADFSLVLLFLHDDMPVFYAAFVALVMFVGTGLALVFGKKTRKETPA